MRFLLLLTFVLNSFLSYSQSLKPIIKDKNWEHYENRVNIGAEFNVGIMQKDADLKLYPKRFFVKVPPNHDKFICVSINSKDGKYKANLEFNITQAKSGIIELELPTNYAEKLKSYNENEVAIIARASSTCSSQISSFYVASWSNMLESKNTSVYINSETPIVLAIFDKKNKREDVRCKKILDSNAISYNCECEVSNDLIANSSKIYLMKVVRSNGESELKKHGEIIIKI